MNTNTKTNLIIEKLISIDLKVNSILNKLEKTNIENSNKNLYLKLASKLNKGETNV